jgi:ribosomal protein L30/L7E
LFIARTDSGLGLVLGLLALAKGHDGVRVLCGCGCGPGAGAERAESRGPQRRSGAAFGCGPRAAAAAGAGRRHRHWPLGAHWGPAAPLGSSRWGSAGPAARAAAGQSLANWSHTHTESLSQPTPAPPRASGRTERRSRSTCLAPHATRHTLRALGLKYMNIMNDKQQTRTRRHMRSHSRTPTTTPVIRNARASRASRGACACYIGRSLRHLHIGPCSNCRSRGMSTFQMADCRSQLFRGSYPPLLLTSVALFCLAHCASAVVAAVQA